MTVIQNHQTIYIDLAAVRFLDFSGVKVLVAARKASILLNKKFYIMCNNEAVIDVLHQLNLRDYFGEALIAVTKEDV